MTWNVPSRVLTGNTSIQVLRLYGKGYSEGSAGMRDPTGLARHPGRAETVQQAPRWESCCEGSRKNTQPLHPLVPSTAEPVHQQPAEEPAASSLQEWTSRSTLGQRREGLKIPKSLTAWGAMVTMSTLPANWIWLPLYQMHLHRPETCTIRYHLV